MADSEPHKPDLSGTELKRAEERSAIGAAVVYEAIRLEGQDELRRPSSALAFSGFAAGLSMGFSLLGEGLLRAHLPDAPWRPLITKLGYTLGFLVVVLGRQQLFTENTLTAVIPLLARRDFPTFGNVMRLWWVVFAANIAGAIVFAWTMGNTPLFGHEIQKAFGEISREAVHGSFGEVVLRGVFAGWLIALMVWLLPAAETSRFWIIIATTYIVGLGGFPHAIAGAVDVLFSVTTGVLSVGGFVAHWMIPTLIGNILGGVALVSALNHAQVVAGKR